MTTTTMTTLDEAARKKRNIRLAIVLGLVAVGFYTAFILMSIYVY